VSEIGELIDSHFPFLRWVRVVLLHLDEVFSKETTTIDKFISVRDGFVELSEVGKVLRLLLVGAGFHSIENGGSCYEQSDG